MFRRVMRDAFPLKRGEWGLGLFLYGLLTLMVAADWVGKLGADSLFVKRWGVNYVPVMYIVTPVVMLAVSAMIFFFVDRVRRRTLLLWYVAGVTLLSIAIQAGVTFQGQLENGWSRPWGSVFLAWWSSRSFPCCAPTGTVDPTRPEGSPCR